MSILGCRKAGRVTFITILAICICTMIVMPALATNGQEEPLYEGGYKQDRVGEYLGDACAVSADGLSGEVRTIVENNPGNVAITISKGGTAYAVSVSPEGQKQLEDLARKSYDRKSIKSKVRSMGTQVSVQADTEQAGTMLSGLSPLISVLTGILVIIAVLAMSLYTALDICYITMPVFRNKSEEMKQSGNAFMTKTTRSGDTKLRWVTDEAVYAVEKCSVESGKNPIGTYMFKRIWAFILVAIAIYILLTGNIQLFVDIALNMVGGILDVLANLGR